MGDIEDIVLVLTEIKDMIRNGDSFESIAKHWADKNPESSNLETVLRESCANVIESLLNRIHCIIVLKNLKTRTNTYASLYAEYGEKYAKELAKVDSEAIDYALSVIQGLAE